MDKEKILVVEDEAMLSEMIKMRLEKNGYEVISAFDGVQALEMARQQNPGLIILDLMLPKIDGYKVCRMLKFDDKYKKIPIIVFTARVQESDKKLGEQVGADAYITKPFDPETLLSKIKELLIQKNH